ncbi:MAG: flagellar basal body-associated FliL family protein [Defluviitaleaceae bacterium]|nr:flagellar basal body-associated FliL family protein [Defluviitaleaceae bacterium]
MDKSKMMLVIIIALLVLLLGTVVGVGLVLFRMADGGSENFREPRPPGVEAAPRPGDIRTVSLGQMTANLALGPGGRSDNVIVEIDVGLNALADPSELEDFYAVFTRQTALARAVALDVFVSRTYEETRSLEGRRETQEIMKRELQDAFDSNLIVTVTFSHFNAVRGR